MNGQQYAALGFGGLLMALTMRYPANIFGKIQYYAVYAERSGLDFARLALLLIGETLAVVLLIAILSDNFYRLPQLRRAILLFSLPVVALMTAYPPHDSGGIMPSYIFWSGYQVNLPRYITNMVTWFAVMGWLCCATATSACNYKRLAVLCYVLAFGGPILYLGDIVNPLFVIAVCALMLVAISFYPRWDDPVLLSVLCLGSAVQLWSLLFTGSCWGPPTPVSGESVFLDYLAYGYGPALIFVGLTALFVGNKSFGERYLSGSNANISDS